MHGQYAFLFITSVEPGVFTPMCCPLNATWSRHYIYSNRPSVPSAEQIARTHHIIPNSQRRRVMF